MADIKEFMDAALLVSASSVGIEPGSLSFNPGMTKEDQRTAGKVNFEHRCMTSKRPLISATIHDPSVILPTGLATVTNLSAFWRAFEENGGLGAGYLSYTFANALVVPKSLSVSATQIAKLVCEFLGLFPDQDNPALVIGTTSQAPATLTKCWVLASLIIGGNTEENVESVNVTWNYELQPRPDYQPEAYFYDTFNMSGEASLRDLAVADIDNMSEGKAETVVLNLVDRETPANTLQVNLGNCDVEVNLSGRKAAYTFTSLG